MKTLLKNRMLMWIGVCLLCMPIQAQSEHEEQDPPILIQQKEELYKLRNFRVKPYLDNVHISWDFPITKQPIEFIIERSADGKPYEELLRIPATNPAGSFGENFHYVWTDFYPVMGISYYRISIIEGGIPHVLPSEDCIRLSYIDKQ